MANGKCDVRYCGHDSTITHEPLQVGLCDDCWGDHCDGKKLVCKGGRVI